MNLQKVVFLSIICIVKGQAPTITISLGGIGATSLQGRVEITRNGIKGTVCDDKFNNLAATVFCRQLNYPNGGVAVLDGRFGPGTGPIWLDEVVCQGNERHIEQCIFRPWNQSNCDHNEDVGIICNPTQNPTTSPPNCTGPSPFIRLVGPSNLSGMGFVEVLRNGVWGSVCDDQWGRDDAKVVCRMLCYDPNVAQAGAPVDINHLKNQVRNNYMIGNVQCTGMETDITQCPQGGISTCDQVAQEYASVTCTPLVNTEPQAPIPQLECTAGGIYARFSRTRDPYLEARHLSIFYPYNGPCNLEKLTTTQTVSIVIPFRECGTFTTYNSTHIFYTNSIKYDYTVFENQIVRVNTYRIEAKCEFPRDYNTSEGYTPLSETVTQTAPGRFVIRMTFYNDSFITPLNPSIQLILGEWLNVALTLEMNDPNLKLVVPNCKATPTSDPNDPIFFNLFNNKCANDPTLGFFPLNSTVFGFRYQTFKFVAYSNVIIQCDAFVCLVEETGPECDRSCNVTSSGIGRKKRDTSIREIYRVVSQPMTFSQNGDGIFIDRGDGWEINLVTTRVDTTFTTQTTKSPTTPQSKASSKAPTSSTTPLATTTVSLVKTTTLPPRTLLSSLIVPVTTPRQTSKTLQATAATPTTASSATPAALTISLTPDQQTRSTTSNKQPSSTTTTVSTSTSNKQEDGSSLTAQEPPSTTTQKQHVLKPNEMYVGGLGSLSIWSGSSAVYSSAYIHLLSILFCVSFILVVDLSCYRV